MYVAMIESRSVIFVKIHTENGVCSDRNDQKGIIYMKHLYI